MAALMTVLVSIVTRAVQHIQAFSTRTQPYVPKFKLPLPAVSHLTLDNSSIKDRNLLLIGDVHGCLDELNKLLNEANSRFDEFLPIFVGDMINKGPKNIETLHKVRKMEHFAVRGNHDAAVLREVLLFQEKEDYQLPSRYKWVKDLSAEDIDYLKELPYTISIPDFNAIVVHAGLMPNVTLEKQRIVDMICMRDIHKSKDNQYESAELPSDASNPWASLWPGPEHVYFGHDARRKLQEHAFATGLDTGCVYGFQLTALLLNRNGSREFITVQAKDVYEKPSG